MEENLTLLEAEIRRTTKYLADVASPKLIKIIAERNLGVATMNNEINVTGVLSGKEEKLSKSGKPFLSLKFNLENGGTLSGSCFEASALNGVTLGTNCDISYSQNKVNDKTYNNFSKVTKSEKVAFTPAQAMPSTQRQLPVESHSRDEIIDLAGTRNNATELIAAIVSTCKTPQEAQECLVELLNQQYWSNLTKTLFNEYKKVKEDVL